jgi:hypothetical protein
MALWRDPIDELIEELERALPIAPTGGDALPRLEDLQMVIVPILFASKEEQARIFADPRSAISGLACQGHTTAHAPTGRSADCTAHPERLISDPRAVRRLWYTGRRPLQTLVRQRAVRYSCFKSST